MTNPQNPYESYLVAASAGCGKTYQLSQRFLYLVAAGAAPSSILTVTFTKKAANEMRARIIEDATRLWSSAAAQEAFNKTTASFYHNVQASYPQPRSAVATAEAILAATQQLKISTIDALFLEWVKRFTSEAFVNAAAPKQIDLVPEYERHLLYENTWDMLVHTLSERLELLNDDQRTFIAAHGFMALRTRLNQLLNQETLIWLIESTKGMSAFEPIAAPASTDGAFSEVKQRLLDLATYFSAGFQQLVADVTSKAATISELAASKLFTQKTMCLSGSYIKGKNKEQHGAAIIAIENLVRSDLNARRTEHLNALGAFLMQLCHAFCEIREKLKADAGYVEFTDLAKACFRLFNDADASGARFLIERPFQHIMLDEFQDTSRLQWGIFSELCKDLLSRNSHLTNHAPHTVFIVGDVKQSIYGFREADPRLMDEAFLDLEAYGLKKVPLNQSFRSADFLMQFTNAVFEDAPSLADFPQHAGARLSDGTFVNPNVGFIKVYPQCEASAADDTSAMEEEAKLVARELNTILQNSEQYPVYDKKLKAMRPIEARDCALLFRKSTHAAIYDLHLRKLNLPTLRAKNDGFFAKQEIQDAVALIRYLAHSEDLLSLCSVLRSAFFHLSDDLIIAALSTSAGAVEQRMAHFWDALIANCSEAEGLRQELRSLAKARPHEALISLAEDRAYPYLEAAYSVHEATQAKANLAQFIELCNSLERDGQNTFPSLAQRLVDFDESDLLGNAQTTPNAINLLTIHKAKGLEYPLVVLVDCGSSWETVDRYWVKVPGGGLAYTGVSDQQPIDHEPFSALLLTNKAELQKESMRLLYVALTRARQYFLATAHRPFRGTDNEEAAPGYLTLLRRAVHKIAGSQEKDAQDTLTFALENPGGARPDSRPNEDKLISIHEWMPQRAPKSVPLIAEQVLSIRPSDAGKNETRNFSEHHEASATEDASTSSSISYGNLVHAWLETHIKALPLNADGLRQKLWDENPAWSEAELMDTWQKAANEVCELLRSDAWTNLTKDALALRSEVPLVALSKGVLIRGKMDLLIEKKDSVWLVDFKTAGDSSHERDYAPQLASYARAIRPWFPAKVIRTAVYYTRHNRLSEIKMAADKRSHFSSSSQELGL